MTPALRRLAGSYGIQTGFRDGLGRWHRPDDETLLAVLRSLGEQLERPQQAEEALRRRRRELDEAILEPVLVAWNGRLDSVSARRPSGDAPVSVTVITEQGEVIERLAIPSPVQGQPSEMSRTISATQPADTRREHRLDPSVSLPLGYHSLHVEIGGRERQALIVAAPRRCPTFTHPSWGVFMPLYALRTEDDWGIGDLGDLGQLETWTNELGGSLVATLPLFATFVSEPGPLDPSPYLPVSRLFFNEAYLDVTALPEARDETVAGLIEAAPTTAARRSLRNEQCVDYRGVVRLKRRIITACAAALQASPVRAAAFRDWLTARPEVAGYARFRAACERPDWESAVWGRGGPKEPEALDADDVAVRYHEYSQWALDGQLDELSGDRRSGLALDLPLGVHPQGFDTWRYGDMFARGAAVGAPPDALISSGQDWSFPPLHPVALRASGYGYFVACLRALMRRCRLLRLDHVMGLHRQYFVPAGRQAAAGTYVRYPAEELYAVIALEASRTGTVVVGEDIGTVPAEVRRSMRRHGVLRMHVLQAQPPQDSGARAAGEQGVGVQSVLARPCGTATDDHRPVTDSVLARPAAGTLAALNTHDLASFAAYWKNEDLERASKLGLIDPPSVEAERGVREPIRQALCTMIATGGLPEALRAALVFLSASAASVVLIALEDLWLETAPQNVPGTADGNWRRRARMTFEAFRESPDVLGILAAVNDSRRGAPR